MADKNKEDVSTDLTASGIASAKKPTVDAVTSQSTLANAVPVNQQIPQNNSENTGTSQPQTKSYGVKTDDSYLVTKDSVSKEMGSKDTGGDDKSMASSTTEFMDEVSEDGDLTSPLQSRPTTPTPVPAKYPVRPGLVWKTGVKIEAKDFMEKWYLARIIEIDEEDLTLLIHFEGWNARYDEWIEMMSDRLRPITRQSRRKEKGHVKKKKTPKLEHRVGTCVFAKWTDCRMYAARVLDVTANGSYEVLFYDGFTKKVQPINIKAMPPEVQAEYGNAGLLPPKTYKGTVIKEQSGQSESDSSPPVNARKASTDSKIKKERRSSSAESTSKHSRKSSPITEPLDKTKVPPVPETPTSTYDKLDQKSSSGPRKRLLTAGKFDSKKDKKKKPNAKTEFASQPRNPKSAKLQKVLKSTTTLQIVDKPSSGLPPPEDDKSHEDLASPILIPELKLTDIALSGTAKSSIPPKAFLVEDDHNHFKCPFESCTKAFRKETLLHYHIKYYHTEDGTPVTPAPPKKRRKTVSMLHIGSTDSEISVGGRSGIAVVGHCSVPRPARRKRESTTSLSVSSIGDVASLGDVPITMPTPVVGHGHIDVIPDECHPMPTTSSEVLINSTDVVIQTTAIDKDYTDTVVVEDVSVCVPMEISVVAGDDTIDGDIVGYGINRDEVVNCICQLNEENGLMIQCEMCLCWQHAVCMELTEDTLPKKYVCYICTNPPGVRDSARYLSANDWHRDGTLPRFGFLVRSEISGGIDDDVGRNSPLMMVTHDLTGDMHNIRDVLGSLRSQMHVYKKTKGNHDEVRFWTKNWDAEIKKKKLEEEERREKLRQQKEEQHKRQENDEISRLQGIKQEVIKHEEVVSTVTENNDSILKTEVKTEPGICTGAEFKDNCSVVKDENTKVNGGGSLVHTEEAPHIAELANTAGDKPIETDTKNSSVGEQNELPLATGNDVNTATETKQQDESNVTGETASKPNKIPTDEQATDTSLLNGQLAAGSVILAPDDLLTLATEKEAGDDEDPFAHCERNLLEHILTVQGNVEHRLDCIDEQLDALESEVEGENRPVDTVADMSSLKRNVHQLIWDLQKVRRMARYH